MVNASKEHDLVDGCQARWENFGGEAVLLVISLS